MIGVGFSRRTLFQTVAAKLFASSLFARLGFAFFTSLRMAKASKHLVLSRKLKFRNDTRRLRKSHSLFPGRRTKSRPRLESGWRPTLTKSAPRQPPRCSTTWGTLGLPRRLKSVCHRRKQFARIARASRRLERLPWNPESIVLAPSAGKTRLIRWDAPLGEKATSLLANLPSNQRVEPPKKRRIHSPKTRFARR